MKRKTTKPRFTAIVLPLLLAVAASGHEFGLGRSTLDGGGAMHSAGHGFELAGTIAQPDVATLTEREFSLTGGYWFPQTPADCNSDGCINLYDLDGITGCLTGPAPAPPGTACPCFDLDSDSDVDLADVRMFQITFGY